MTNVSVALGERNRRNADDGSVAHDVRKEAPHPRIILRKRS
jgi:hypothetical protein